MNQWKWNKIRKYWLRSSNIPFVFVVGNPNLEKKSYVYKSSENILEIGCEDHYDDLVYKIAYGVDAIIKLFNPEFILKIDDDIIVDTTQLHNILYEIEVLNREFRNSITYCGVNIINKKQSITKFGIEKYTKPSNQQATKIDPVSYCAGPMYYLGKEAMTIIQKYMNPDLIKFEDVNVGMTLNKRGIFPHSLPFYVNSETEFMLDKSVGWHDIDRKHVQNIM
jgi:hypothetical protein